MLMRLRWSIPVLVVAALGGCRFKGGESFTTTTEPNPRFEATNSDWKGDPNSVASHADPVGGLKPETSYSKSAGSASSEKVDPVVNRPTYGSGTGTNEIGNQAAAGHGQSNAPAFQGEPNGR